MITEESFGRRLRRERERRKIALSSISANTKISAALFEALEREDVSRWPAGIFRRAFIRAYAENIGLDADDVVREFLERFPDPAQPLSPALADCPHLVACPADDTSAHARRRRHADPRTRPRRSAMPADGRGLRCLSRHRSGGRRVCGVRKILASSGDLDALLLLGGRRAPGQYARHVPARRVARRDDSPSTIGQHTGSDERRGHVARPFQSRGIGSRSAKASSVRTRHFRVLRTDARHQRPQKLLHASTTRRISSAVIVISTGRLRTVPWISSVSGYTCSFHSRYAG